MHAVARAYSVGDGVHQPHLGVAERRAGHGGGDQHVPAGVEVGAVADGERQPLR